MSARAAGERGNGGSGAEAPDRGSANTLPPPFSCLISPQPALPIEPSPTPQYHPPCPRPSSSFSFLDLRQRPDWSSTPDGGSSEMTNCPAKQSEMQNFENTWIKVSVCRDCTHVPKVPPKSHLRFVSGSILIFRAEV